MHIAFVSEHASPLAALGGADSGGQNVYVAQTSNLLARRGHLVDVYTRRTSPAQPETVTLKPGLRVVHVDAGPPEEVPKEDLLPYMPAFTDAVETRMRRDGIPDIVHAHFWMSGMVAADIKARLQVPFVITFHALGRVRRIHQGDADRFPADRESIEQSLVESADRIIAECPQDVADLMEHYAADPDQIVQVPCGFDPDELGPVDKRLARELLSIDPATRVVLQLGRMVPRKGVDDAIRGFVRATRDRPEPTLMLVVGGEVGDASVTETGEGARLLAIAREEGGADRIRFTGSRSRESLRYFYSAADVFVSVPWYEPFGITPLEAMACGVPVVGSSVGGVKYSVADGKTGILVPPKDPDAVAEALTRLLSDDRERERMGRDARDRVNASFTWDDVTRSLDSVYDDVIGESMAAHVALLGSPRSLTHTAALVAQLARAVEPQVERAARLVADTALTGGRVFVCGNGGSAADSQHLAAELVGRFELERSPVAAVSLTTDTSAMTAIANDYGFEDVFARQLEGLGTAEDILVAISTSGGSPNVLRALAMARDIGMRTVGLLGRDGGQAAGLCDVAVVVPSAITARIQEVHQLAVHHIAAAVDDSFTASVATRELMLATTLQQGYLA